MRRMIKKRITFEEVLECLEQEKELTLAQLFGLSDLRQDEVDIFRDVWSRFQDTYRAVMIQQMVELAEGNFEANFKAVFRACLNDGDERVRTWAIEGLWEDEREDLIPVFEEMAKEDTAVSVRASAVAALGKFVLRSELHDWHEMHNHLVHEVLSPIIDCSDENLEVRRRAVEAIAYSGNEGVTDLIRAAYFGYEEEKMRVSAVFAMGRSADKRWKNIVVEETRSPNPAMRYEAARACGELVARDAVKSLISLVEQDPDRDVQEAAIWALGQIGGRQARRALECYYELNDERLRQAVEEAWGELELSDNLEDWLMLDFAPDEVEDIEDEVDEDDMSRSREQDVWDSDWEDYRNSVGYISVDDDFDE